MVKTKLHFNYFNNNITPHSFSRKNIVLVVHAQGRFVIKKLGRTRPTTRSAPKLYVPSSEEL